MPPVAGSRKEHEGRAELSMEDVPEQWSRFPGWDNASRASSSVSQVPSIAAYLARRAPMNGNMLLGICPGYCVFFHTCAQRSRQIRFYNMSGIAAVALV